MFHFEMTASLDYFLLFVYCSNHELGPYWAGESENFDSLLTVPHEGSYFVISALKRRVRYSSSRSAITQHHHLHESINSCSQSLPVIGTMGSGSPSAMFIELVSYV